MTKASFFIIFASIFLVQKSFALTTIFSHKIKTESPLSKWERYIQSDLDSCKILIFHLTNIHQKSPNDAAIFHLISGSYLARVGFYEEGIKQLSKAKSYFFQLQDLELLTKILNEIGIAFQLSGNRHEAKYYYEQSILSGEQANDELLSILAEINLAKLNIEDEKYEVALEHLNRYIFISKKFKKYESLSNAYATIVDLYLTKEDLALALKYAKELQYVAGRSNSQNVMIQAITNQAILAFYSEENEKAEDLFQQILFLRKQQKHPLKISEAYFNLAGYYLDFNLLNSKKYLDSAYQIALKNRAYSMQEDILLFKQSEYNDTLAAKELKTLRQTIEKERKILLDSIDTNIVAPKLPNEYKYTPLIIFLCIGNLILISIAVYSKLSNKRKKSMS